MLENLTRARTVFISPLSNTRIFKKNFNPNCKSVYSVDRSDFNGYRISSNNYNNFFQTKNNFLISKKFNNCFDPYTDEECLNSNNIFFNDIFQYRSTNNNFNTINKKNNNLDDNNNITISQILFLLEKNLNLNDLEYKLLKLGIQSFLLTTEGKEILIKLIKEENYEINAINKENNSEFGTLNNRIHDNTIFGNHINGSKISDKINLSAEKILELIKKYPIKYDNLKKILLKSGIQLYITTPEGQLEIKELIENNNNTSKKIIKNLKDNDIQNNRINFDTSNNSTSNIIQKNINDKSNLGKNKKQILVKDGFKIENNMEKHNFDASNIIEKKNKNNRNENEVKKNLTDNDQNKMNNINSPIDLIKYNNNNILKSQKMHEKNNEYVIEEKTNELKEINNGDNFEYITLFRNNIKFKKSNKNPDKEYPIRRGDRFDFRRTSQDN